jgi:hypothetical protein
MVVKVPGIAEAGNVLNIAIFVNGFVLFVGRQVNREIDQLRTNCTI